MNQAQTPYACHIFICTNTRGGERKSCGDEKTATELKNDIKAAINRCGWKGTVRITGSGCLGACESGPNIMLYPQQIWFSAVQRDDLPAILKKVEEIVEATKRSD